MKITGKVQLTKEKETLFTTLYAKTLDYHSKQSILHEKTADDILNPLIMILKSIKILETARFDVMSSFAIESGKEELEKQQEQSINGQLMIQVEVDKLNPKLKRITGLSFFKSIYNTNTVFGTSFAFEFYVLYSTI